MSVVDTEQVDFMGIHYTDKTRLCLAITDHVDWEDEDFHLELLQEKINSYLQFILEEQYRERYPKKIFRSFEILIAFQEEIPEKCLELLSIAEKELKNMGMNITFNPIHLP